MTKESKKVKDIVVVEGEGQFQPLLSAGYNLATANEAHINVLVVNETTDVPHSMRASNSPY